ncbi:MAG TPA: LysM peptidoglycan-binding domain-containing protein [Propionibacteriaceae bacterium]|nr:LysM peptidoglycan-binding domain-containing protein [Propionibacteriaceae bacterium]
MRFLRGVVSLVLLAAGLAGLPALLTVLGPDLRAVAELDWRQVRDALLTADDGSVAVALIAVVAWVAWAVFAVSVLAELVRLVSLQRVQPRLPGLGGSQRLVAALLISVLAMLWAQPGHAEPAGAAPRPAHPDAPSRDSVSDPGAAEGGERTARVQARRTVDPEGSLRHQVVRGDDLWSLAERYYGRGRDWRKIAQANGDLLSGGPDRLEPGWSLLIPEPASENANTAVVGEGDTLSAIAAEVYGDASRWPDLYAANRAQLGDPNELEVGMRLELPSQQSHHLDRPVRRHTTPDKGTPPDDRSAPGPDVHSDGASEGTKPSVHKAAAGQTSAGAPSHRPSPPQRTREDGTSGPASPAPQIPAKTSASTAETSPPAPGPDAIPGSGESLEAATLAGLATAGGLLAAGMIATLAARRRLQLHTRPLGRRIPAPDAAAQLAETCLGKKQRPMSLRTLDVAIRAIAAHCRHASLDVPELQMATVGDDVIELRMASGQDDAPVGFVVDGTCWRLEQADARYLRSVPGVAEAPRPYPTLVSVGTDDGGAQRLVNLESLGLFALDSQQPSLVESAMVAMVTELASSPWAEELTLTLVGACPGLSEAVGRHNVARADDLDRVLERLEQRAAAQRAHDQHGRWHRQRIDPDLAEPWVPEVVFIGQELGESQRRRLDALTTAEPRATIAAVIAGGASQATWSLDLEGAARQAGADLPTATPTGRLQPVDVPLVPQLIQPPAGDAVLSLLGATGSELTEPAPWWPEPTESPPDSSGSNIRYLAAGEDARDRGTAREAERRWNDMDAAGITNASVHSPVLLLLGPIELVGAAGPVPARAARQCMEYCGWLLEHRGATAQQMAASLLVAEGTRRSNMSRLRSWLGCGPDGEPYLPDAYTGRIMLDPTVSSDWIQLQLLVSGGLPRTSTRMLRTGLEMVRGAPLADAAPVQWHWAEELRTDMISLVRDIGVELATRALADHDIDLARWAAARALAAAPGDELLLRARISTEHQAGNRADVERLTLQLAAHARTLGVDLDPDTVSLMQEVMEGQVRARLA